MSYIKNILITLILLVTNTLTFADSGIFDRYVIVQLGNISYLSGSTFNNTNFGELTSNSTFLLVGGQLKTFKNGVDDITGGNMYYTIYKQSTTPLPSFDTVMLPWKEDVQSPLGSIDQTWEQNGYNFNILNGLDDGAYFIEVYFEAFYTDSNGSSTHVDNNGGSNYKASFSINNCKIDLGDNMTFCSTFNIVLNANPGHTSYLWNTGDTVNTIFVSQPGTYIVTITNPTCTAKDSVTIYSGTSSFVLDIGNDTTICGLGNVILNTGGGFTSYQWSTGDTLVSIPINTGGLYSVTVSTTDNCLLMDERLINFNGLPLVDLGSSISICVGDSVVLDAGSGFTTYLWSDNSQNQNLAVYNAGTYSVTVTDSAGCSGFDVVTINTSEVPVANFTYIQNESLVVNFTDLSQYSTQNYWDFVGNGNFTAYNTGNVSYTYPFAGTYIVKMIASNNCTSDTTDMTINVTASIDELSFNNKISLYPNPSDGLIYLEFADNVIIKSFIIRNVQNQVIQQIETIDGRQSKGQKYQFDFTSLSTGMYFIEIASETSTYHKKIIIR